MTGHSEFSRLALIAVGSNLGNPRALVAQAMDRLQELSRAPLLRSSLWRSAPIDCPPGSPSFVNGAVALVPQAGETPDSLLKKLQGLERSFGRKAKRILNEPRSLDLDLIAFGDLCLVTEHLIIPHPRAQVRRFVIQPLSEIAPDFVIPGQSKTVRSILAEFGQDQPPLLRA